MGDPKKSRKIFKKPRRPWNTDQLMHELETIGNYGLRNKRELWKAQTELSRIRTGARNLLAIPHEIRQAKERELLRSLGRLGLVAEGATLDDVLNLTTENLLERRLQSVIMRKKLAKTPNQARQMVVHGHVLVGGRVVSIPSYMVRQDEEPGVVVRPDSSLAKMAVEPATTEAEPESAQAPEGQG